MGDELRPYTHDERWRMYMSGEAADFAIFAEMKSNLRLVNGDHWQKKRYNVNRLIDSAEDLEEALKIRITKNHIQNICRRQVDAVLAAAPGVGFEPHNKSELQDQKAAELNHAVWLAAEERLGFEELEEEFIEDLVELGEQHAKVIYDPTDGPIVGYYSKMDKFGRDTGEHDFSRPIFRGGVTIKPIEAYNLVRPVESRILKKSEWLAERGMVDVDKLKAFVAPELQKFIQAGQDETYPIYDATTGGFRDADKECFVVEMYFRPSPRYPKGHFYFMTRLGDIYEDDLPAGKFPIISQKNRRIKGSPRGRSDIKTMRPFQVEINRCASKIAETHTTVGDDKILLFNGAKASAGILSPGIRKVEVTGPQPVVLQGRDGSQFLNTAVQNVSELYQVMQEPEESADTSTADPFVMLFRSAKQKQPHNRRIRRHSRFKREVVKLYLALEKVYMDEEDIVNAVGKNEQINIAEFKNSHDLAYEVKVSDQSNDIETKLGQQLMYNMILQYSSNKLSPEVLGLIFKNMPYANGQAVASDLTIDIDAADNDLLALDRGERPPVGQYDNHGYQIKRITKRMKEASFRFLDPMIQQNYQAKLGIHQEFDAYNKKMMMMLEKGLIPTTGYLVVADLYVPSATNAKKTERVKIPADSLRWLIDQLKLQGTQTEADADIPEGARAEVAAKAVGQ